MSHDHTTIVIYSDKLYKDLFSFGSVGRRATALSSWYFDFKVYKNILTTNDNLATAVFDSSTLNSNDSSWASQYIRLVDQLHLKRMWSKRRVAIHSLRYVHTKQFWGTAILTLKIFGHCSHNSSNHYCKIFKVLKHIFFLSVKSLINSNSRFWLTRQQDIF